MECKTHGASSCSQREDDKDPFVAQRAPVSRRTFLFLPSPLRHDVGMGFRAILIALVLLSSVAFAQNWKQVHRKDEAKWAKTTGLDPSVIHKMWRTASNQPDEKDDDSRIATIDLQGLSERHDVLFVTYAGENNCLTLTVFREFSEYKFDKEWSVNQTPDGKGFCDTSFGSAAATAETGNIFVRVPRSVSDGNLIYTVYAYEWNGIAYRYAGERDMKAQ